MYKFHHDYIKTNMVKTIITDTDSLMYKTETENIYDNLKNAREAVNKE